MTVIQFSVQGRDLNDIIGRITFLLHNFIHNYVALCIRCCEYALLVLEHWPDAPEVQRSADLYEDLIRCCVADAMSEVSMYCTIIMHQQLL